MKLISSALLELAGIASISAGFFDIAPWAGFIAGGVGLVVCGMAVDPPQRAPKRDVA